MNTITNIRSARLALLGSAALGAIALSAGAAHAEDDATDASIVVTGQRVSTENAIAAKKDADTVVEQVSADDLGKLPDANVADAIARVPGVSVVVNQDTGEGEYVAIRGLSGTYNSVTVNGVRVAQTDPSSRDVSLSVLPPNGLAAIRVTKTLTPDLDGDAIAGSIDFRTPTAFDFHDDTIVRVYASGGFNGQAKAADEGSASYQGQLDFGKRFGGGDWGFFGSFNYGVSHGNGQETENDGEWEPDAWRKDSEEAISETNMHLPGIDLDYRRLKQTRYGGNFSLDYHGDTTQLYFRGQYARQELVGTNDVTDYRSRPTERLTQLDEDDTSLLQPDQVITGHDSRGNIYGYTTSQILDADGDGDITDADRYLTDDQVDEYGSSKGYWSLKGRSGVWDPEKFQFARNFSTIDVNQTLATLELGGQTQLGGLQLVFSGSYSTGTRENPGGYSIGYNCDACTYPLDATGLDWVSADPRFPHASMPAYAQNVERDPSLLPFDGASYEKWKQKDDRYAFKLDGRYDFDGALDYIKAGVKFSGSKRKYDYTPIFDGDLSGTPLDGKNLADSGLIDKEVNSILGGEYYYGAVLDRQAVVSAIDAAMAAQGGSITGDDLLADDKKSSEDIYAGYLLGKFGGDTFNLIAGARVEHRKMHNEFWSEDEDAPENTGFDTTDRSYTEFLPSLTATYRPSNDLVVHGALWTGYSPPEYGYVSGGQSVTRDPGTHEIIAISRGNPDLKAAKSYNADLSLEYYPDPLSVISVAGFYKHINDFIFTNGSQVNANTQNGTIEITQPQNGETAELYGVEFNLIKTLQGMPAPFDGFGFEGNLTVQHSKAETGIPYREGRPIPLINAPDLLYNIALTYQKYGFEAKLSYSYRGKFIESLRDNAVDKWVQHNRSVDLHTRYNFSNRLALDFDVGNLLKDWKYYTTKGDNPSYQKDYMEPGRTYMLRLNYSY